MNFFTLGDIELQKRIAAIQSTKATIEIKNED